MTHCLTLRPKDPIAIISLLAAFKLVYVTNDIREEADMRVLPHLVHETPASVLNSRIYAKNSFPPFAT